MLDWIPQWSLVLDFHLQGVLFVCFVTDSISLLVISLFKLSISSWFKFDGLYTLEICPFLLGCPICWHIIVIEFSYGAFFAFLCYQLLVFPFHFLFCLYGSSPFSFWWTGLEICLCCWPLQRTNSILLIFLLFFKSEFYFVFSPIFIMPFLLLTLHVVCPYFSNSFVW